MLFYVQPSSSGTAVDLAGVGRIVCPGAIAGCFAALGTGFTGLEAGHPGVGGTLGAVSGGVAALALFPVGVPAGGGSGPGHRWGAVFHRAHLPIGCAADRLGFG